MLGLVDTRSIPHAVGDPTLKPGMGLTFASASHNAVIKILAGFIKPPRARSGMLSALADRGRTTRSVPAGCRGMLKDATTA